ncbi:MAG: ATP-binding protein [Gemmatimonadaceae bacterium]
MSEEVRARILMVDDRPENLLALEAILEPLDQELVRANSGDEALRRLLVDDVAVILLDVQMPGLNGFETARLIKSRERSRHIPIIFLTAINKEEAFVFEGYSVGAVDYMFKPFQPDVLRSKVAVFVELHGKQQQLAAQEQQLREHEKREMELRHVAELGETEARLGELVDSAMDAIIAFGEDRRITLFNAAAERLFYCRPEDALGRSIGDFFPPLDRREMLDEVCAIAERERGAVTGSEPGTPEISSFTAARTNGETFPIEVSISCLDLPGGKVFTMIGRDISERRRAEEELRSQAESLANTTAELTRLNEEMQERQEELERAMTARSRFYASMSHELRTPINAVLGYNTLLLEHIYGPLNDKQSEGLRRTQRAAKHLLELVNDVLDLSKIEAGKIDVRMEPVLFPALVEDLFVTVGPLAEERGSVLTLDHEGESTTVETDPRRVRQILLNLLSNAIKFGAGRPIRVTSVIQEDGGIEIAVIDQGEGIPEQELPRIFDEFVQLSKGQEQQGTGLGLPISRRLALLLHGELDAQSEVGKGSNFRLRLPANGAETAVDAASDEVNGADSDDPLSPSGDRVEVVAAERTASS